MIQKLLKILSLLLICTNIAMALEKDIRSEAWEKIKAGALVVDVRTAEEYSGGHIDGALNIPHDKILDRISELGPDKGRSIVLYCKSGRRAGVALNAIKSQGFENAINAGGYSDLAAFKSDSSH